MVLLGTNFKTYNKLILGDAAAHRPIPAVYLHPAFPFSPFGLSSSFTQRKTNQLTVVNGLANPCLLQAVLIGE